MELPISVLLVTTALFGAFAEVNTIHVKDDRHNNAPNNLVGANSHKQSIKSNQGKVPKPQFVPDKIIVKLKSEADGKLSITTDANNNVITSIASLDKLNKKYGAKKMERILKRMGKPKRKLSQKAKQMRQGLRRIYKIKLKKGKDVLEAVSEYKKDPNVEYAEPNYIYHTNMVPNDPGFNQQWGLHNTDQTGGTPDADIDAPEAWDIETGDPNVVIAVVDTGVDWDHPDLAANIWTNSREIEGNGIDDDGNGYIDDYRGWDFVNASSGSVYPGEDPGPRDNDPMDFQGHGTHVSGIIGAVTNNNIGVAGVTLNCKLMVVRAGYKNTSGSGEFLISDAANAITYACDNGANVVNMSFGASLGSNTLKDAIDYAYAAGVTLIAASGNDGCNCMFYPAAYENVITVGATDYNDNKASFSNYGYWIDVVAPGVSIYSTLFDDTYGLKSGTSMATPYVSGLAGLILSHQPGFTNIQVRKVLRGSSDDVDSPGWDENTGYGRINAYNTLLSPIVTIDIPNGGETWSGTQNIQWTATDAEQTGADALSATLYYGSSATGPWTEIATGQACTSDVQASYSWDTTSVSDGNYWIRVTVSDGVGGSGEDISDASFTIDNISIHYVNGSCGNDSWTGENQTCSGPNGPKTTIQAAIYVASDGNTIIVADGTYTENINFNGKAITVRSENGAATTIIDGNASGSVVTFNSGEGAGSVLEGFTIQNGSAGSGGGIFCYYTSPTITDCTISSNSVSGAGGGIYYSNSSSPVITNCTISGNTANEQGGGIFCSSSSLTITNCTITGNSGNSKGGGISSWDSLPTIYNCTISGNTTNGSGGGIYCFLSSSPTVVNSILWGNNAASGPNAIYISSDSSIYIAYSDFNLSYISGSGTLSDHDNINVNPHFVDPANGDYHLQTGSLCIDAANSGPPAPTIDKDGNPRYDDPGIPNTGTGVNGDYYDMGAYENQNVSPPNTDPSVTVDAPNGGETWTGTQNILWTAIDAEQTGMDALIATLSYGPSSTGPWTEIASGIPCTSDTQTSYSWDTNYVLNGTYWVHVTISDWVGGNSMDVSHASFNIGNLITYYVNESCGNDSWAGTSCQWS